MLCKHLDDFSLAQRVGPKDVLAEFRVGVVIHAEVDGHDRRFKRQHVTRKAGADRFLDHFLLLLFLGGEQLSLIGMSTLPQPGRIAAPADVPEREFRLRKTRKGIGFDVGRV